jgi:hypothetical protein
MLTKRTFLLTAMGLLTGFVANAQSTATNGPGPTDIMGLAVIAAGIVVLLMGVMTGVSMAEAATASYRNEENGADAEAPTTLAAVAAEPQVAAPAPVAMPAAPAFTAEPVAA